MGQRRDRLGFALEAGQRVSSRGEAGRQDLDRDRPIQPGIGRAIHLAHSPGAKRSQNDIWTNAVAWREDHGRGIIADPGSSMVGATHYLTRGVPALREPNFLSFAHYLESEEQIECDR